VKRRKNVEIGKKEKSTEALKEYKKSRKMQIWLFP